MLSLFECIAHSWSLSVEKLKWFAIVNWIFHVSHFLRLFMMSFKYALILLRYSSTDMKVTVIEVRHLFLYPLLSCSI